MNAERRWTKIIVLLLTVLLTAFFLFACKEAKDDSSDLLFLLDKSAEETSASDSGANNETLDANGDADAGDEQNGATGGNNEDASTVTPGSTDEGGNEGENGTENNNENTETSGNNEGNSTQGQGGDLPEERNGYYRVTSIQATGEWTVFVGAKEVGKATFGDNAVLSVPAFLQSSVEVWQKPNEQGSATLYLYFEALNGFYEVRVRSELHTVQIDLTEEELQQLLPAVSSPENQGEGEGQSGEGEPTQGGESTQGNEPIQGGESTQGNEPTQGGESGSSTGTESSGEGNQSVNSSENTGSVTQYCPICNAELAETSAHLATCSHYAVLPAESAAHDFLSAFAGMLEDITVTALDQENEIYSFTLNYLSKTAADALDEAMNACTVKSYQKRADDSRSIHVQKALGGKMFTFVTEITKESGVYKATVNLTGFAA